MNIANDIKVSVCIITYNQERYIAECLESVINQNTDFMFEIIVGEDCSTDNTRLIVQKYVNQYPDLIIPLFYKNNVGAVENLKQVYQKARGKYIAHMDGDDLALPNKLQIQFDILENNPTCNVCSHDVVRISSNGKDLKNNWTYPENIYDLYALYHKLPFFAHSSKMFKNKYDEIFWDNLLNEKYILDIDIHVENLLDGDIFHIGKTLGAYRVGSGISFEAKVNDAFPLGAKRLFEKALIIFKDDDVKLAKINSLYAHALLQCAYNYAIFNKDKYLFKEYVNLSINQKLIGVTQVFFKLATYMPNLFFILFKLRSQIKNGFN